MSLPTCPCGVRFETTSWQPCWCPTARAGGHRMYPCSACGGRVFEPECVERSEPEYGAR